jgi:hypothetical protein
MSRERSIVDALNAENRETGLPVPTVPAVPLWAQILGLLVLVAFVALSIDAYFGPGLRTRLGLGNAGAADGVPARVFYEPGPRAQAGQKGIGSEGQERVLLEGDAVLLGATHQIVRLGPAGRVTQLTAPEGTITTVANLGLWQRESGRLTGANAQRQRGQWLLDDFPLTSAGAPLHPPGAPSEDLPDGFTLGPEADVGRVRRVSDGDAPAVRLRASRKAALFSLNSREPIPSLDDVLVTITAVVRGQPGKTIVLALRDVTDAAGNAETVADRRPTSEEWTTLSVRRRVADPSPGDSFSVGIMDADGGDWFEVRDLTVVLGVVP